MRNPPTADRFFSFLVVISPSHFWVVRWPFPCFKGVRFRISDWMSAFMRSFTETPNLGLGSLGLPVEITCSLCWVAFFDVWSPANVKSLFSMPVAIPPTWSFSQHPFWLNGGRGFLWGAGVGCLSGWWSNCWCRFSKIAGKGMFTPVQIGPKDPKVLSVLFFLNYINLAKNSDKDT